MTCNKLPPGVYDVIVMDFKDGVLKVEFMETGTIQELKLHYAYEGEPEMKHKDGFYWIRYETSGTIDIAKITQDGEMIETTDGNYAYEVDQFLSENRITLLSEIIPPVETRD